MTIDHPMRATPSPAPDRAGGGVLARAWRGLRWYVRELTGEAAYQRYVEGCRRAHPDRPPLDRRAYFRARQDEVESQPQQRCC